MIRLTKIVLILLVGLWGLISGIHNLLDTGTGYKAVADVVGSDFVAGWKAIESPLFIWLAFSIIPLAKFVTAFMCLPGGFRMWQARKAPAADFNQSKRLAVVGCAVSIAMLYGAFMVAAESYFGAWMSELGALALPVAFRYIGSIGIIMIYVHMPDE